MANEFKVKKGLIVDGSGTVLDVQGTEGQLFSVTDSLTGDLFSVSDVSGVPIFNINANGNVAIGAQDKFYLDGGVDTYIQEVSDNNVKLFVNGAESLQITTTTIGSNKIFHLNGTEVIFNPDGDSQAKMKNAGTNAIALFAGASDELYLGSNDTTGLYFTTGNNAIFTGHVGFSNTTPSFPVDVNIARNSEWLARFRNTGTSPYGIYVDTSSNAGTSYTFAAYTAGPDFYIRNDGHIGIGAAQPKNSLEVATGKGIYVLDAAGDLTTGTTLSTNFATNASVYARSFQLYRSMNTNAGFMGVYGFFNTANSSVAQGNSGTEKFIAGMGARAVTSDSNAGDDSGGYLEFYTKPEAGDSSVALTLGSENNATFTGNVTVNGSLIGKSDHTTELGSYSSGQIKRIRMSQGGEVVLGDSSTANPIGLTEGVWNSFGDSDYVSIYSRNSFRVFGYGTSATPQTHMFVGRHTSSGGSFLGVGNITAPNGTYGTSNTILTVKATTSGGEGIVQIVGLGNNATDNVGCLAFHSYAEADPMASIRSVRGNADDKGSLAFNTNNGGTETTKMIILPTGEIGIGTTTPLDFDGESRNLVIRGGVNGTNPTIGITIAGNGNQAATGRGAIRFADGTTGDQRYRGGIEYNHNGDVMSFRTSAVQRVSIGANNSTDGTMMIQAHDNSWNGGLYLKSADGNVTAKLHPENSGNYGLMLSSNFYVAGNTGLGTEPGAARLEVAGGSLSTNTVTNLGISTALTAGRTRTYDSGSLASVSVRGDASSLELAAGSSSGYYSGIGLTARGATAASGTIIGYTYGVQRFRVDADGDFGINTTNPTAKFHVVGTTKLTGGTLQVSTDTTLTSNYSYTFRDAVGINNPNSTSAATNSNTVMAIGGKSGGNLNTSLITTAAIGVATAAPASILHVHGTQSYGTIRVSPTSANGESAMAFFMDTAGTTTGTAWVVGHAGWGNTGDFVIGNQQYGGPIMLIQQDGKVGIGSTTPSHKLQVYDATSDAPFMIQSGDGYVGMKFKDPNAEDNLYYRGDIESFYFTGNRLGINTSSPTSVLTLDAPSGAVDILLKGNTTNVGKFKVASAGVNHAVQIGTISNNELQFHTNDTERMRIANSTGFVGIGTTAPASMLTIDSNQSSGSVVLDVQGTEGQLFSITNSLSGDLFSVADVSGVPILNVNSSGAVEVDGTFKVEETSTFKGDVEIHNEGNDTIGKLTLAGNNNTGTPGVKTSGTIEHRGADLKTVITHNGSDVITIGTGTQTTFAGDIKQESGKVIQLNNGGFIDFDGNSLQLNTQRHPNTGGFHDTAKTHAGITLTGTNGNSRILFYTTATNNTAATTRLTIDKDGKATFAGNLTVQGALTRLENSATIGNTSGDYLEVRYNDSINYAAKLMWKGLQFGNNGVNKLIAGRNATNGYFDFYVNNTNDGLANTPNGYLALTLAANKDAAFKGNVTVYTGASTGALSVGRNSSERLEIHQSDTNTTVTAFNDADENQEHNFILDRSFGGSGGNNFLIRKDGSAQLSIDKDAKATFAGDVVLSSSTNSPMLKLEVAGVTSDYGIKNVGGEFRIIHTTTDVPLIKMSSAGKMGINTGNASIDTNYSLQVHGAMKGASLVLSNDGSNAGQLSASGLGNSSNAIAAFAVTDSTSGADTVHIKQANTVYGANAISFFYGTTEANGYIRVNPNSTVTFEDNSDYRLKENIKDLTGSLGRISDLRPVTFSYKNKPTYTHEGFVAHEAMTAIPSAVTGVKDGVTPDGEPWYQGVDMKRMIPDLVGAIKELKAQNEDLLNRVKALESK